MATEAIPLRARIGIQGPFFSDFSQFLANDPDLRDVIFTHPELAIARMPGGGIDLTDRKFEEILPFITQRMRAGLLGGLSLSERQEFMNAVAKFQNKYKDSPTDISTIAPEDNTIAVNFGSMISKWLSVADDTRANDHVTRLNIAATGADATTRDIELTRFAQDDVIRQIQNHVHKSITEMSEGEFAGALVAIHVQGAQRDKTPMTGFPHDPTAAAQRWLWFECVPTVDPGHPAPTLEAHRDILAKALGIDPPTNLTAANVLENLVKRMGEPGGMEAIEAFIDSKNPAGADNFTPEQKDELIRELNILRDARNLFTPAKITSRVVGVSPYGSDKLAVDEYKKRLKEAIGDPRDPTVLHEIPDLRLAAYRAAFDADEATIRTNRNYRANPRTSRVLAAFGQDIRALLMHCGFRNPTVDNPTLAESYIREIGSTANSQQFALKFLDKALREQGQAPAFKNYFISDPANAAAKAGLAAFLGIPLANLEAMNDSQIQESIAQKYLTAPDATNDFFINRAPPHAAMHTDLVANQYKILRRALNFQKTGQAIHYLFSNIEEEPRALPAARVFDADFKKNTDELTALLKELGEKKTRTRQEDLLLRALSELVLLNRERAPYLATMQDKQRALDALRADPTATKAQIQDATEELAAATAAHKPFNDRLEQLNDHINRRHKRLLGGKSIDTHFIYRQRHDNSWVTVEEKQKRKMVAFREEYDKATGLQVVLATTLNERGESQTIKVNAYYPSAAKSEFQKSDPVEITLDKDGQVIRRVRIKQPNKERELIPLVPAPAGALTGADDPLPAGASSFMVRGPSEVQQKAFRRLQFLMDKENCPLFLSDSDPPRFIFPAPDNVNVHYFQEGFSGMDPSAQVVLACLFLPYVLPITATLFLFQLGMNLLQNIPGVNKALPPLPPERQGWSWSSWAAFGKSLLSTITLFFTSGVTETEDKLREALINLKIADIATKLLGNTYIKDPEVDKFEKWLNGPGPGNERAKRIQEEMSRDGELADIDRAFEFYEEQAYREMAGTAVLPKEKADEFRALAKEKAMAEICRQNGVDWQTGFKAPSEERRRMLEGETTGLTAGGTSTVLYSPT